MPLALALLHPRDLLPVGMLKFHDVVLVVTLRGDGGATHLAHECRLFGSVYFSPADERRAQLHGSDLNLVTVQSQYAEAPFGGRRRHGAGDAGRAARALHAQQAYLL